MQHKIEDLREVGTVQHAVLRGPVAHRVVGDEYLGRVAGILECFFGRNTALIGCVTPHGYPCGPPQKLWGRDSDDAVRGCGRETVAGEYHPER